MTSGPAVDRAGRKINPKAFAGGVDSMSKTQDDTDPLAQVRQGLNVHHGKTPAAWVGALTALVGFFVGGIGLILGPNWLVLWIGLGIVVVALIAARIMQVAGMGAKGMAGRARNDH